MEENIMEYSADEQTLLNYACENGMIDFDIIRQQMELSDRKKYLEKHLYSIWQSKDKYLYTYLPDELSKKGRKLIKKKNLRSLENAIISYYRAQEIDPYVKDVFEAWVQQKLDYGEVKKQTYDRYRNDFKRFFKGTEFYYKRIGSITEDMLEDFIKKTIYEQKLTKRSFGNLKIIILGTFKYAKKRKYTQISITNFIGDLEISRNSLQKRIFTDEESVFTDEEIEKSISYIKKGKSSILDLGILLAIETGVRVGELSTLKPTDLNDHVLNVSRTEERFKDENGHNAYGVREFTKGRDGSRKVVVTDRAVSIITSIRHMNPFGEYLFMKDGERVKAQCFSRRLERVCNNVGIIPRSMHKIRKTYATRLINKGVDEKLIIKQMGHTDFSTTRNYYYFNNRTEEEAQKILEAAIR